MKNIIWDVMPRALVITEVLEELSTSIISVTRIGELGALVVTSNQQLCISSQRASVSSYS
jgi:hypothetical protein